MGVYVTYPKPPLEAMCIRVGPTISCCFNEVRNITYEIDITSFISKWVGHPIRYMLVVEWHCL